MAKAVGNARCTCQPGYFLAALVLLALGFWGLIQGLITQWDAGSPLRVLPWYFVGFLLLAAGKYLKWQSCAMCPVHGWKK